MKLHWKRYLLIFFLFILVVWIIIPKKPQIEEPTQPVYYSVVEPVSQNVRDHRPVDVLVVSGGGAQGIIPLHVLAYLEKKTGKPISQLFDLMVGTSTGAIIVMTLDAPDTSHRHPACSADQLLDLYNHHLPDIFYSSWSHRLRTGFGVFGPRFTGEAIYHVFNQVLGSTKLSQVLVPLSFPVFDLDANEAYIFDSWSAHEPGHDYYLSQALAGAVATPMIFKPYHITSVDGQAHRYLIDGAVVSNTPEIIAYLEAIQIYPHRPIRLISLGNGMSDAVPALTAVEPHRAGILFWLPQISDIILQGHAKMSNDFMANLGDYPGSRLLNFQYIDLVIPSSEQQPFNGDPAYLRRLNHYGAALVLGIQPQLDTLAAVLAKDHQAR